jgi:hypothetical protein
MITTRSLVRETLPDTRVRVHLAGNLSAPSVTIGPDASEPVTNVRLKIIWQKLAPPRALERKAHAA